jgi:hypothetical protein
VIIMTLATLAEAIFVSGLQPSEHPTPDQVAAAIRRSLRMHGGVSGCASAFAAEYGEHPEESASRMHWALSVVVHASLRHDFEQNFHLRPASVATAQAAVPNTPIPNQNRWRARSQPRSATASTSTPWRPTAHDAAPNASQRCCSS